MQQSIPSAISNNGRLARSLGRSFLIIFFSFRFISIGKAKSRIGGNATNAREENRKRSADVARNANRTESDPSLAFFISILVYTRSASAIAAKRGRRRDLPKLAGRIARAPPRAVVRALINGAPVAAAPVTMQFALP